MTKTTLTWTDDEASAAIGRPCALHELRSDGRRARAVVLAVVAGFGADGSGSASLDPVCAECARLDNVIPCRGLGEE
jgi:hypothetical protein